MKDISIYDNPDLLPRTSIIPQKTSSLPSTSFEQILQQSLSNVNQLQLEADKAVAALATGEEQDLHNTMITMEKADIAFRLLMQIRNKVINAYETIMRMGL
ncbi:MAG: flagellar hook-basal body complex protein FliE [Desulfobacterales bacterium]|jgi:flagellar hook-basal body complex protein FliE